MEETWDREEEEWAAAEAGAEEGGWEAAWALGRTGGKGGDVVRALKAAAEKDPNYVVRKFAKEALK